ncbi:MAG: phenylalanine--tRNA ligase subunit beta [Flavobacteriales bacterium]|nr:phenylalanine--tRNA ligase subunit beta [Flavobacteriales bacterium]
MKISYNWLNNYLNLNLPIDEISSILTDIGLEVEGVQEIESVKGGLKGVVIGEVLSKIQHPNADRLNLTTINVGEIEPLQIVCGAKNIDVGQKVPVATIGTILHTGEDSLKIKKGKIRGELSYGMICSESELGLGESHDGIMVLDKNAEVGIKAKDYFKLETDTVFEIGLTPNRSDAMGHIGVARDLLTSLNYRGEKLQMCKPSVKGFKELNKKSSISVEVKDFDLCPRYSSLTLSNVQVTDSPDWLQNKLKAIGLNPVNNVVDITNFVLHETGQPLHAFDMNKIQGKKVIVSRTKNDTKFITLDNKEIKLSSEDLMINDAKKPMCIAGVMGGVESSVNNDTRDIFLESAYFDSISIRKSSKRHTLSTDASFRYERGCDPNITVYALKRAALLIMEICGGSLSSDINDLYPKKISHFKVILSYDKMDKLIGEYIDRNKVISILRDLEIDIADSSDDGLTLLIPPYRTDVKREVDVIEEILRIYGFNNVTIPSNLNTIITSNESNNSEKISASISNLLSNNGFNEIMNNSLTKDKYSALIPELDNLHNIKLLNPLSQDLNIMRQTLLFNGLENIAYNLNRKNKDLKFYEFGKTYHKIDDKNIEKKHLQILVTGRISSENWNSKNHDVDFYFIKKIVESVLSKLGINKFDSISKSGFGRSLSVTYSLGHKKLVSFGKVSNKICNYFDISKDVFMADFNWDNILKITKKNKMKYKDISKFPSMRRDLSLLLDKSVTFEKLKDIAKKTDNKILKKITLFDVYEGKQLSKDKKSYSLSFIFEDESKTLTDKIIDKIMNKLITSFIDKAGAEIR